MKPKIFTFAALLLIVAGSFCSCGEDCSCRENNPKEQVCNVDNPLTDLLWLKEIIDEIKGNPLSVTIYQCIYGNRETGFLIGMGKISPFYNCEGEVLCIMGGVA